jgi:hypothetical protein
MDPSDRRIEAVAAKDRVERGEVIAPALARVALADCPCEEHQRGHEQVIEQELERDERKHRRLRVHPGRHPHTDGLRGAAHQP